MKQVLVDTSVWIEFFKKNSQYDLGEIEILFDKDQIVTCSPIFSEVLSGQMSSQDYKNIRLSFSAMSFIDVDWSKKEIWEEISLMAQKAYKGRIPSCGLADRMILFCALKIQCQIWTFDKKLSRLAEFFQIEQIT